MNLLGSALYDPTGGAAVTKATTALLAMTAIDTANAYFPPAAGGTVLVPVVAPTVNTSIDEVFGLDYRPLPVRRRVPLAQVKRALRPHMRDARSQGRFEKKKFKGEARMQRLPLAAIADQGGIQP